MRPENRGRLRLLYLSLFPASPPVFGAQRRMHGIMTSLAHRHDITAASLLPPDFDPGPPRAAMSGYCREVVLVPSRGHSGVGRRLRQLLSLASPGSFERAFYHVPRFQEEIDRLLAAQPFDIVNIEAPYLAHYRLRAAPPGAPLPRLVLDEHNIEFDLVRQMAESEHGFARKAFNGLNWRKVRREEARAWRDFHGVTFTSGTDQERARAVVPSVRSAVVPNAVDVEYFRPRQGDPEPDGQTVMFFGDIQYFPNSDALLHFFAETWPILAASHPRARLKIVGPRPTPAVLAHAGPRVEVTGLVDDLRPHLAGAALVMAPLRIGGGTRFKIIEAMSMAKAVVSTTLGAEGIEAASGREIVIADDPPSFAAAIGSLLDEPARARSIGAAARGLVEQRYSWEASSRALERFFLEVLAAP